MRDLDALALKAGICRCVYPKNCSCKPKKYPFKEGDSVEVQVEGRVSMGKDRKIPRGAAGKIMGVILYDEKKGTLLVKFPRRGFVEFSPAEYGQLILTRRDSV